MPDIKIPTVGESITTAQISIWHKADGDTVAAGDLLLTLETDKVSTDLSAETAGVLHIIVPAGTEVAIGSVVGSIREMAASTGAAPSSAPSTAPGSPPAAEPIAEADGATSDRTRSAATQSESGEAGGGGRTDAPPASASPLPSAETRAVPPPPQKPADSGSRGHDRSFATAGPQADPVREMSGASTAPGPGKVESPRASSDGRTTRTRLSPLRRKIATHLVSAQQTAAILTTFNEADMSAVIGLRQQLQESFVARHGLKLGFMSFFVKAVVDALRAVPQINSRLEGDELIQHHYYDIGVAVGTEKGLVVPVLRGCDTMSFAEIERAIAEVAKKARDGKLLIDDLQGGVFTISNGGIYGSLLSTPILNPPQSGILGMHSIQERPVAINGQIVIRPMMYLALSYDHRVVDGKEAVTFLMRIKECLENPARLLLGA